MVETLLEEAGLEMKEKCIQEGMKLKEWKRDKLKNNKLIKEELLFGYELGIGDLQDSISSL